MNRPFTSYDQCIEFLYGRLNYERQPGEKIGRDAFKLNTIRSLLAQLGHPEKRLPTIHIAGTKGKGSVASMVSQILVESGFRVGTYSSPHLETVRERTTVNGQLISREAFVRRFDQMANAIESLDRSAEQDPNVRRPTFFEITTALSLLHFAESNVDFAVLEVGMGGRLDSTNACEPSLSIITNISLDHTRQLGSTVEQIAFEKAGIIKPGVPVVCGASEPAASVIKSIADKNESDFHQAGIAFDFSTQPDQGLFDPW